MRPGISYRQQCAKVAHEPRTLLGWVNRFPAWRTLSQSPRHARLYLVNSALPLYITVQVDKTTHLDDRSAY